VGKAQQGLAWIQKLYRIEKAARTKEMSPEERKLYRQQHAAPVLEKMRTWLDASLPNVPPGTLTGKALNYLNNEWPKLVRYLEDGRLEIDNNLAENAIRPFAGPDSLCTPFLSA
jgi:transposase